ncbi:glycosyltransferase family 39 protein [Rufibacter hautae]|uniref:Glycosyltransferase RgtA/B/C/D-like domain-containing protein n=1 Tax=Rufibacter hautae TaxID=2595005 RepID=A0A5B6T9C2_9BACT|nr:glycosyltransferase family 39 protein [Rufibacter hautae]KAA3436788.1 hypothetical protein FOA19_20645 [Rufibacter hautae]
MTLPSPSTPVLAPVEELVLPSMARRSSTEKFISLFTWLAISAGILVRLFHYFDNRSLWRDELYLGISLIRMNFWELATQPLAYEQKAPLGFLWAERLAVEFLGKGEMALRLFPLLCGIAALFAFVPVAKYFLKPWAAMLAVAMLALGSPVVYHSVEAKQYSTELMASVLALLLYVRFHKQRSLGALFTWGLAGAVLLWFSYSVIFVLAGIGMAVSLKMLRQEGWKAPFRYLPAFGLWVCSFAVTYVLFLGRYQDSQWLTVFFEKYCQAYLPVSFSLPKWLFMKANEIVKNPLGQTFKFAVASPVPFIVVRFFPLLLLGVGMVLFAKKSFSRFTVLAFPLLLALLASFLKQYPFYERLVLFLAPMFIMFICYCAQEILAFLSGRTAVKVLLATLLFSPPLYNAAREIITPDYFLNKEKGREALLFINEKFKEGDAVYVYWNMWHVYDFYKEAYNLKFNAVKGEDLKTVSANEGEYLRNLSPGLRQIRSHNRLWYLYDSYLRVNIGGFVDQPAWYFHKDYKPGQTPKTAFSSLGEVRGEQFTGKDAVVLSYQLVP